MKQEKIKSTEMWNARYQEAEFAYGISPSSHLVKYLPSVKAAGMVLFPAEGEGRNAVYAATKGYDVSAFDYSIQGRQKTLNLARKNFVSIDYQIGGLEDLDFKANSFDAIILIYAHFFSNIRAQYHKKFIELLKPGGLIILEGFSKKQIEFNTINPKSGGPKNPEMLFSESIISEDFFPLKTIELTEVEVYLNEGAYHQGDASLMRYVGQKG